LGCARPEGDSGTGLRHETAYLAHLAAQGLTVENLGHVEHHEEQRLIAETLALMDRGADVIAQGALSDGEWFGRPDVLRRMEKPSKRWTWSYEVADTKLARETKATTILQLSLYSDLLKQIQGTLRSFCGWYHQARGTRAKNIRCWSMRRITGTCKSDC